MTRKNGWRSRLGAVISAAGARHFEVGVHDCALFTADCVLAMTGIDLAEPWRGKYSTYREGLGLMLDCGYQNPKALVAAHFDAIHVSQAVPGDLCFVRSAGGVLQGHGAYVLTSSGLGLIPVDQVTHAFRVG